MGSLPSDRQEQKQGGAPKAPRFDHWSARDPRRAACRASGNDFTCRSGKPRKGRLPCRRDRAHRLGAWGKALRARDVAPQGVLSAADRPTFAGESRGKCPRSRSGLLGRWVFGELPVSSRRQIFGLSTLVERRGFGGDGSVRQQPLRLRLRVARVSAGALHPESDSRVSVVFATCRGPRLRSERRAASRTTRIVSRGLAPRVGERTSLGKGSDRRQRHRPSGRPSEAARVRFLAPGLP